MSQEYAGALAIMLVSILKIFHIEIANDVIAGLVTGAIALWVAIRRYQRGDITVVGSRK